MQPLSTEPTMPTSDFGLHMKNTPVYPFFTYKSFLPSSPVKDKIRGCGSRLLLQEYLLWYKTQKPHDLGFYWDQILDRLEAHQISVQATRDWDRAFSWESMGIL